MDALLKDSMFDSSVQGYSQRSEEESMPAGRGKENEGDPDLYGGEEFESYDESRRTFTKSKSRTGIGGGRQTSRRAKGNNLPRPNWRRSSRREGRLNITRPCQPRVVIRNHFLLP